MIQNIIMQIGPRLAIMLINQLATLLTIPWLTWHLSPQLFGFVATALIVIQSGWVIIDWGGMNYSSEVWKSMHSKAIKNSFVTNLIISKLFLFAFYLSLILLLIEFNFINLPWSFFIAAIPATFFGGIFPLWFYHVIKKPGELVYVTLLSRLIFLLLVVFYVKKDADAELYLQLFSITMFVITSYAIGHMVIKHHIRWEDYQFIKSVNHINTSASFFINSLTNNYIQTIWSLALAVTGSPIIIGLYNIAEQCYRAGTSITNAISQVIRLNSLNFSIIKTWQPIKFFGMLYFILAFILYFLAEPLVKNFFSIEFYDAIPIIKIMILVWLLQSLVRLINYPILGKLIGILKVHRLNPIFILLHGICLASWLMFGGTVISMVLFLALASFLQLFIMFIFTLRK